MGFESAEAAADEQAKGLPFWKGKTLRLDGNPSWVVSKIIFLRVSRAELIEFGVSGFVFLVLRGFPAKAWVWRLMGMVG